jgi:hypothetical protein|uniref:Zinc-ribbon containing domain protein n=1 Tax=Siphoviridae sp. ctcuE16 TaxID=2826397 RepID=A0A8S5QXH8_9CAUD|nr:MAG TPA: zinc-ribbon containing domain protein [Siphoviridae sp. ctcuE16]
MLKCEKCIHKKICIDGANYRNAEVCRNFVNENDFTPVVHGHWVYNQNGHDWGLGAWECSLCHSVNNNLPIDKRFSPYVYAGSKYCPNCGAKMDGGENNGT